MVGRYWDTAEVWTISGPEFWTAEFWWRANLKGRPNSKRQAAFKGPPNLKSQSTQMARLIKEVSWILRDRWPAHNSPNC